jgi:capsular exopolysaccharide synthesis family protein
MENQDQDKKIGEPETVWVALEGEHIPIRLDDDETESLLPDKRLVVQSHPASLSTEQFRVLYTKIAQVYANRPSVTLAITSAIKGEGKTFTAFNLAVTMARDFDQKVLLIEGDLKRPSFHTYFKEGPALGLVDVLAGRTSAESCWISLCHHRLRVLQAGKVVDQSTKLLSSEMLSGLIQQMREQFRYIILDTPPILPLADMNIFSQWVDGILLVVRASKTPRSMVKRAIDSLSSEKIIGAVLNGIEPSFSKYYYGSYYKK